MRLQLLSDLHLESDPSFRALPAPGADLLVLAGDIGSYQHRKDGRVMPEPDWGLRRFSPLPQHAGWPTPVLYVPGNHEYDALDIDQAHRDLRATCERLGIQWLEREATVIHGVRFVGTTLWSDYDALVPTGAPLTDRLRLREKAFRAANFYLHKMAGQRAGALFDAAAMRELALDCQAWLREALAQPHQGPTVVVTHFAPPCTAPTRATAKAPAPPASAMRWTSCCRRSISGCTATCIAPPMCKWAAAASWPIRWAMPARASSSCSGPR